MKEPMIINANETLTCPHCEKEFALKQAITQQTIEGYEQNYNQLISSERQRIERSVLATAKQKAEEEYLEQIAELKTQVSAGTFSQQALQKQLITVREQALKDASQATESKLKLLENDLNQKDKLIQEFASKEIQLRNQKNEIEQKSRDLELHVQRRLDEEKLQVEIKLSETFKLKEAEWHKKMSDAQTANEQLTRKLEQGSQQLQGEVLELEIEEELAQSFPFDTITPIAKGVNGADILQAVITQIGNHCGAILWEAKRAKSWGKDWISKLKQDQQNAKATLAVLVTTIFPVETKEPFILYEGVWVVRPSAAKSLAAALRAGLITTAKQRAITAGKGENMAAIYDYLCSPQFTQKVVSIWEAQQAMQEQLISEQNALKRQWKVREKQLERISTNVLEMCGELQGIAGSALPQLENIGQLQVEEVD